MLKQRTLREEEKITEQNKDRKKSPKVVLVVKHTILSITQQGTRCDFDGVEFEENKVSSGGWRWVK